MTDTSPLPSFRRPPVNEVVLSVAFDRPPRLTVAHLGDFWHRFLRENLPEIEEQPPYHRPIEILGGPQSPPPMSVQLLDRPPSPRLWAKSLDGTKLVQLQTTYGPILGATAPAAGPTSTTTATTSSARAKPLRIRHPISAYAPSMRLRCGYALVKQPATCPRERDGRPEAWPPQ
jgi:hypothetical protein